MGINMSLAARGDIFSRTEVGLTTNYWNYCSTVQVTPGEVLVSATFSQFPSKSLVLHLQPQPTNGLSYPMPSLQTSFFTLGSCLTWQSVH